MNQHPPFVTGSFAFPNGARPLAPTDRQQCGQPGPEVAIDTP